MVQVLAPRAGPTGLLASLMKWGLRIIDVTPGSGEVLVGRYDLGGFGPGTQRMSVSPAGPQPWPVVGNGVVIGAGRWIVLVCGSMTSPAGNGYGINLQSTTGGANLSGFTENVFPNNFRYYTLVGMITSTNPNEETFVVVTSSPAPPTPFNTQMYIARLGD